MSQSTLFKYRHFEPEIILLCLRWYLRYSLSYRDLEEMMVERGPSVDHTTIYRWVQHFAPILEKKCRAKIRPTNDSWRVDETYITQGVPCQRPVDVSVPGCGLGRQHRGVHAPALAHSPTRNAVAAKHFFRKALRAEHTVPPRVVRVVNVDRNPAYPKAMGKLKKKGTLPANC